MTRALVSGGLGFLGSAVVRELAGAGIDVRIFNRQGSRASGYAHPAGHHIAWGDIRDREAVERAVAGVDIVVHTVSNFREARTDHEAHAINVGGTDNILQAAARAGVSRIALCSTIGVHGDVTDAPADEDSPLNPGDVYQETKALAERRAREFERDHGLPVCIIRPASIYGPGDLRMLKLFQMIRRRRFIMLGSGNACFHPAYVDDVARGFLLGVTHPAAGGETFIIGSDRYLPLRDLVDTIARHLQVPSPGLRLPLAPLEALAHVCELACRPFGWEPPLYRRRMSFFRNNRAFSIAKARRILGYAPRVNLDSGVERTIAWYEDQGYLARRSVVNGHPPAARPIAAGMRVEATRSADTSQSSP